MTGTLQNQIILLQNPSSSKCNPIKATLCSIVLCIFIGYLFLSTPNKGFLTLCLHLASVLFLGTSLWYHSHMMTYISKVYIFYMIFLFKHHVSWLEWCFWCIAWNSMWMGVRVQVDQIICRNWEIEALYLTTWSPRIACFVYTSCHAFLPPMTILRCPMISGSQLKILE